MTDPALFDVRRTAAARTAGTLTLALLEDLARPHGLDAAHVAASIDWSAHLAAGELRVGDRGEIDPRQVRRIFAAYLRGVYTTPVATEAPKET